MPFKIVYSVICTLYASRKIDARNGIDWLMCRQKQLLLLGKAVSDLSWLQYNVAVVVSL